MSELLGSMIKESKSAVIGAMMVGLAAAAAPAAAQDTAQTPSLNSATTTSQSAAPNFPIATELTAKQANVEKAAPAPEKEAANKFPEVTKIAADIRKAHDALKDTIGAAQDPGKTDYPALQKQTDKLASMLPEVEANPSAGNGSPEAVKAHLQALKPSLTTDTTAAAKAANDDLKKDLAAIPDIEETKAFRKELSKLTSTVDTSLSAAPTNSKLAAAATDHVTTQFTEKLSPAVEKLLQTADDITAGKSVSPDAINKAVAGFDKELAGHFGFSKTVNMRAGQVSSLKPAAQDTRELSSTIAPAKAAFSAAAEQIQQDSLKEGKGIRTDTTEGQRLSSTAEKLLPALENSTLRLEYGSQKQATDVTNPKEIKELTSSAIKLSGAHRVYLNSASKGEANALKSSETGQKVTAAIEKWKDYGLKNPTDVTSKLATLEKQEALFDTFAGQLERNEIPASKADPAAENVKLMEKFLKNYEGSLKRNNPELLEKVKPATDALREKIDNVREMTTELKTQKPAKETGNDRWRNLVKDQQTPAAKDASCASGRGSC